MIKSLKLKSLKFIIGIGTLSLGFPCGAEVVDARLMDTDKAEQIADNFFRRSVALVARNPELINQLADLWIRIVIDALNGEVTIEEATVYRKKTKQRLKKDAGIPCNASLLTSEQKRMYHSLERRFEEVFVQNPAVIQPFLLFIEERLNFSNEEKVQLQLANETLR